MGAINVEKRDGIATVTLSNPGKHNALNVTMWECLAQAFASLSADLSLRCVIVRGEGGHFAAGADIAEFPEIRASVEQGMHYHKEIIGAALNAISHGTHPTLAAIEGDCIGGGLEIACACDIRIAAANAQFGIPINRLGFPLAPDEMRYLLQLVGPATTLEILLEGRVFGAAEALGKGLLHRIVVDDLTTEIEIAARRIAAGAPLAARMNKQLVRRLSPHVPPLNEQEVRDAFAVLGSADYREGVQAFLDKRAPDFVGM